MIYPGEKSILGPPEVKIGGPLLVPLLISIKIGSEGSRRLTLEIYVDPLLSPSL